MCEKLEEIGVNDDILYSRIYWRELNLADCSKRVENRNWRILICDYRIHKIT